MSSTDADRRGIVPGYWDNAGQWHDTPEATRAAIITAMGGEPSEKEPVRVVHPGHADPVDGPCEIHLEDGGVVEANDALPVDLPPGYHDLVPKSGDPVRLICAPETCPLPASPKLWGWAAQLYAARSKKSWGIGDLADLKALAAWSKTLGAEAVMVNPLAAATPLKPQRNSPYYPSSRRYRNPLYLRIEEVDGANDAGVDLESIAKEGRALNAEPAIGRDQIFDLKTRALETIFDGFAGDPGFDEYVNEEGGALTGFARFNALAEHFGSGWRDWPDEFHDPSSSAVERFAKEHAARVDFHRWVQWQIDRQLARASAEVAVIHDLPIGVDPGGADAWAWQDCLALDARAGAPPDAFNAKGQDWGTPPFVPHKLKEKGYRPFVETIRAGLRHAGALRIDHVMGLFRLFWIPAGMSPADGTYVRYPYRDLLAILALEAHRAGAFVIGEDLGTVEDGVREEMTARHILGNRVLWFEPGPPDQYPEGALATITTHDLPTVRGLFDGSDVEEVRSLGLDPNEDGLDEIQNRVRAMSGLGADASGDEAIVALHRLLATAPSRLLLATLDDAAGAPRRPNVPGTHSKHRPNWSIPLPVTLEELKKAPLPKRIAEALRR